MVQNETLKNDPKFVYNNVYDITEYRPSEDVIENPCLLNEIEPQFNIHVSAIMGNYRP